MITTDPLRIPRNSVALILQDLQNDVISDGGAFADSGAPNHAKSQGIVKNVSELAQQARALSIPVVHIHYIVEPGAKGLQQNAPLFRGIKDTPALVRGTWGAEPVEALKPKEGDFVIEKLRMNGFYNTKLESLLRGLSVDTVIITGAWTNMSIEHSARHAADLGFEVIVPRDGTSTVNDDWQHAGLDYALTNIGVTPSCKEVLAALE